MPSSKTHWLVITSMSFEDLVSKLIEKTHLDTYKHFKNDRDL
jgi:hypothetical protein